MNDLNAALLPPDSYYEEPILEALRACVRGEFANWTPEQHEHLKRWCNKYPQALAWAAATFLDEQGGGRGEDAPYPNEPVPEQPIRANDYFGLCPHCKQDVLYLNVGRDHFKYCDNDRVYWYLGSNLFSSWREEDEESWSRNRQRLDTYTQVEPFYWPETVAERKSYRESAADSEATDFPF